MIRFFTAVLLIAQSHALFAVEDYEKAKFEALAEIDSILPNRLAQQYEPEPNGETWVHVRHMGDVGTPELQGQIANSIQSDRSTATGLLIPNFPVPRKFYQRGYIDAPEYGTNVYQVYGKSFGWQINTWSFSHEEPIECPPGFPECSGGPNIAYSTKFKPAPDPWLTPSSELTLQAEIALPTVHYYPDDEPIAVAQISFEYYIQNKKNGFLIGGLIGIFDTRSFHEVGYERLSNDGVSAYVSSDLRSAQPNGEPYRYMTISPYSNPSRYQWKWEEHLFFRAHVSYENLENIIRDSGAPGDPSEYRILEFGILIETFPRIRGDISFAGSFRDLGIYRFYD